VDNPNGLWTEEDLERQQRDYQQALKRGAPRLHRAWQLRGERLMSKPAHIIMDPRALSAPEDSELWGLLLAWAYGDEHLAYGQGENCARSLYGALHGLRCGVARLERSERRVRLTRGLWPEDEYNRLREAYLVPHADRLRQLLARLGEWAQETEDASNNWAELKQEAML
jgi:hypothetical protein